MLTSINSLRQKPNISRSVTQIMARYEAQTKQEAATGKNQHAWNFRCYNTTDTITSNSELQWTSEGYLNTSGKKRIVYDDLSLHEWAVGQLNNIYQIQDPAIVKKALLQTIMALKDMTSLPWLAIRSAYVSSMRWSRELSHGMTRLNGH